MTPQEIMMSLELGLIYGMVAMGLYLTFRILDFPDLTCDGSFVLGAATSSMILKAGYGPELALGVALLGGAAAGACTSMLYAWGKVTDLLSGILVSFMLYSLNLHVMGGIPNIALIGMPTVFHHLPAWIVLGGIGLTLCAGLGYLLMTDFGLALRAVGQNKTLVQKGGIKLGAMTLAGLALSNGVIALGGALFSQHQGFADVGSGIGTIIVGLASVMLGERILPYRSPWIQLLGCLVGSIVYRFLVGMALHSETLGLQTQDLNILTGLMIVLIMALPRKKPC